MAHTHHHEIEQNNQTPYLIGIGLNLAFIIGEMIFAKLAGSTALFADALHSVSDVASLILSWLAVLVFGLKATRRRTYGFHNTTILASAINAILLLIAVGIIWFEAIDKLINGKAHVDGDIVIWVALVGILVNFLAAHFFAKSGQQEHDLNARGAYIHLLADAGVSVGVVISGVLIALTGWNWIDPLVSALIGIVIVVSSWDVFKQSLNLLLNGVPAGIDEAGIADYLANHAAVKSVHDLHIWGISTTEAALTAHLAVTSTFNDADLDDITETLKHEFGIAHTTIQAETHLEVNCNTI
ncbi:cation transporter [Weissella cibaria]|uniref:cation diffusion facilitator family transporter n=1 Tax=Weissella cibaria TaxID=137591 RepID=UPI00106E52F5|nr:cation diffusion facilitator family transporter [Weissella cibaria]MBZ5941404.1 cation diffusion facilitator family transporter [Weissella cibaria]MCT0020936.1 cation transporter [Weissella cibaria]MCT8399218.1 cation transporter [Weissella cibaria]MCT8400296.1 cation transporter [Weissella cibaria]TVV24653.1 cation transporter [Weissella cibaria]